MKESTLSKSETKTASCEGGRRRLQIPERGGRAVGLFQSLFGAASAPERCSKSRSEGSTVKVSRLVELGAEGEEMGPVVGKSRWTPEEDDRLRMLALLSGASLGSIATEMRRSTSAIRHRALKLKIVLAGLPKERLKAEGKSHWTLREERRLLEFASARMSVEAASEKLKRSVDSILTKSLQMDISLGASANAGLKAEGK
jgi:hypothetical protein